MKPAPKLAAIDSSYAREAKIAQRTIKAQDKLILDLKGELEKQKSLLKEHQNETQQQSLKIVHLEHEIQNVKQLNRSLQEDNESYQILLHEKTMNGEFMMNPIMQVRKYIYLLSIMTYSFLLG
jgi:chromosome segregation ATPase